MQNRPITDSVAHGILQCADLRMEKEYVGIRNYRDRQAVSMVFNILNNFVSTEIKTKFVENMAEAMRQCGAFSDSPILLETPQGGRLESGIVEKILDIECGLAPGGLES
jgi:hypothetical protein